MMIFITVSFGMNMLIKTWVCLEIRNRIPLLSGGNFLVVQTYLNNPYNITYPL